MRFFDQSQLSPLASSGLVFAACFVVTSAAAQSSCSSDGQRIPTALVERFISADCDTCWANPRTANAKARELALDWIVPGAKGDDAPLSAAASRDALQRLQAIQQAAPADLIDVRHKLPARPLALRVARGVALGGYMGTSIELKPTKGGALPKHTLTAWLLLVEEIPAGTEGTPVARDLVRNALVLSWNGPAQHFFESRPMSIPNGANPDRLRVVGWVEDGQGLVLASAASVCHK